MSKITKRNKPASMAHEIYAAVDKELLSRAIVSILTQGGAVMLGQTRDNEKLIVTAYLDGEQDKEYCSDAGEVEEFIGQYQI